MSKIEDIDGFIINNLIGAGYSMTSHVNGLIDMFSGVPLENRYTEYTPFTNGSSYILFEKTYAEMATSSDLYKLELVVVPWDNAGFSIAKSSWFINDYANVKTHIKACIEDYVDLDISSRDFISRYNENKEFIAHHPKISAISPIGPIMEASHDGDKIIYDIHFNSKDFLPHFDVIRLYDVNNFYIDTIAMSEYIGYEFNPPFIVMRTYGNNKWFTIVDDKVYSVNSPWFNFPVRADDISLVSWFVNK